MTKFTQKQETTLSSNHALNDDINIVVCCYQRRFINEQSIRDFQMEVDQRNQQEFSQQLKQAKERRIQLQQMLSKLYLQFIHKYGKREHEWLEKSINNFLFQTPNQNSLVRLF